MTITRTILILGLAGGTTAAASGLPPVDITELVMWAIHDDTHQLVQYSYGTDTSTVVGVIRDQHGHVMDDLEALGYIPTGTSMGFYTIQNSTGCCHQKKLMRINGMNATATVFDTGPDIGYTRGMDTLEETPGNWVLYCAESFSSGTRTRLKRVDPATGATKSSIDVHQNNATGPWICMEGLAFNDDKTLYGISHIGSTNSVLWTIDPVTGFATQIGVNAWRRIEALQFAKGDYLPKMTDLPASAQAWGAAAFAKGVLFAFADNDDEFLILNPLTGAGVPAPGSFTSTDVEGLNFMNVNKDAYVPVVTPWD